MVHSNGQTWLEFGKGDVDLFVSYDGTRSLILLENASAPRQIGVWEDGSGKSASSKRVKKAPAIMTFDNVESIDAVIYSLTKARAAFLQYCNEGQ